MRKLRIFLVVFLLVVISGCNQTNTNDIKKEFISESLIELYNKFNNENNTYLQKEKLLEQYKNKYVTWEGYVKEVGTEINEYDVWISALPIDNYYNSDYEASITMNPSEKEKLLSLNKGDKIIVRARLRNYLGFFSLEDGIITSIKSKELEACLQQYTTGCTTDLECINKSYIYCGNFLKANCKFGPTEIECT